jgi:GTP-binding protein
LKFVDETRIKVISGNGGRGCLSFRREKFVPKGGPDGGDGGKGGDVVIEADISLNTLLDTQYQQLYRADRGAHGMGKNRHGKSAPELVIKVPVGTLIKDEETGELIADLDSPGRRLMVAEGGRGGRGNARFATPRNRAPRRFEEGSPGQERSIRLELKLMADVGLVGMPNSGKSTLISRVSNARPKIADYPFTTKVPGLGVVRVGEYKSFVMADIPGLIEHAAMGMGMGHRFLRHIERTRVLLHLVDPDADLIPEAAKRFSIIMDELASYDPDLVQKPMIAVITKMDITENKQAAATLKPLLEKKGLTVHEISAVTGTGIKELLRETAVLLERMSENQ